MKKIIGVLGVAVIAVAMFFSVNNVNVSSSDTSLAILITMNTANAEVNGTTTCSATAGCPNRGSVSCGGTNHCVSGIGYVTCDGKTSSCSNI